MTEAAQEDLTGMPTPKQDERTPGGKNAPSIVEVARRGWDAARRSAKMTGLSSCGPWEELPKEMRDALTQVATEGWLQGTREGQDWARKGSYDNAPTDPHHGGKICNAYGSTYALRSALAPFARLHDEIDFLAGPDGDPDDWAKSCTWPDLKRAKEAYAALSGIAHPPAPGKPCLGDIPKMIAGASEIESQLAIFVDHWGLDSYTPPDGIRETVRGIVTLALNEARAALSGSPAPSTEGLREALAPILSLPDACVESLRHQRQVDADGCEVGVSRQAVDEVYAALTVARALTDKGEA